MRDKYWCRSIVIVAWFSFAEKNFAKFLSYSYSSWLNLADSTIELITRFHVEPTTKFSLSFDLIGIVINGVIFSISPPHGLFLGVIGMLGVFGCVRLVL
jgi:hypothetical protein